MVPATIVEKAERQALYRAREKARKAKREWDGPRLPNREREFIAWDGEGPRDTGYSLFGNSKGLEICHPNLGTRECLELILETGKKFPTAIHIAYGFNYDVSMILRELTWRHLNALRVWNATTWGEYRIEHIPHKWFKISDGATTVQIFDIVSFFGGSYVKALRDFKVGTESELDRLATEKARRASFLFSEIADIREYYHLELRLMPALADTIRNAFLNAGFDVRSWHGPGSVARLAMNRHHVKDAMSECPPDVRIAARYAFAGGRFEMFRGGLIERKIYNADLNSAYPYYATQLPNLSRGSWHRGREYQPGKYGIYYIRYKTKHNNSQPFPLFRRLDTGEIVWPNAVEGWYWAPEAELVANDPNAQFLEAYIFTEENPNDRPFAFLAEYYRQRKILANAGSQAEYTFKLIINSVYGQLAQRSGWDRKKRKAPYSHQLEWAGYITSGCRASVYRVGHAIGEQLISIDTDGVYAFAPIGNLNVGKELGEWSVSEYDAGVFWQSGIYYLKEGDDWTKGKTRGLPKGKYTADELLNALAENRSLKLEKNLFIGYGMACNGRREDLNKWERDTHEIIFGGQGKRYHNEKLCGRICRNGIHEFIPRPIRFRPDDAMDSRPHYLPWLGNDPITEMRKKALDEVTFFDANELGDDEEWVWQYAD